MITLAVVPTGGWAGGSYDASRWQARNHYVFWFHDTTFECIADGFDVELHDCSMSELLAKACQRLVA
jgi:hypothetical protein